MYSRPVNEIPRLNRGNSRPVVAVSPRGNRHIYPSITEFVTDVDSIDASQRRTANRRVAAGGGYINGWFVTDLRGYRG